MKKKSYGTTAGGIPVEEYTLTNAGMEVKAITYGGVITSIKAPDRDGNLANVALGCKNLKDYETKSPFFGCITGRFANRIAAGKFTIDGQEYKLALNDGPNSPTFDVSWTSTVVVLFSVTETPVFVSVV